MLFLIKFLLGKFIWSQLFATNCNVVANLVAEQFFRDEKSFFAIFGDEFLAKKSNIRSSLFCDEFIAIFASKLSRRKKFVAKRSFSCSDPSLQECLVGIELTNFHDKLSLVLPTMEKQPWVWFIHFGRE